MKTEKEVFDNSTHYELTTKKSFFPEYGFVTVWGILAYATDSHTKMVSAEYIDDVSDNRSTAERILNILKTNFVSPQHMVQIIEEYLQNEL